VAEGLGKALQKLPQRFESARDLREIKKKSATAGFFVFLTPAELAQAGGRKTKNNTDRVVFLIFDLRHAPCGS
jgi:hypothetical protein